MCPASVCLTVLIRVVVAVHVPVAELPSRMAGALVQTGPAASRAALRWAAVGGVHRDVLVVTLARPTAWGGETQVLAVAVVFPALVGSWGGGGGELSKPFFFPSVCASEACSCPPDWLDLLKAFKPTTREPTSNHSLSSPSSSWYQSWVLSDGKIR